jgi:hypothetical protein
LPAHLDEKGARLFADRASCLDAADADHMPVHILQAVGALLLGGEGAKVRLGIIGAVVLARTLLQVSIHSMLPKNALEAQCMLCCTVDPAARLLWQTYDRKCPIEDPS